MEHIFQCGIIPYVQLVGGPLSFGAVEVWPNSASEWKKRAGWDHTDLTNIYLDRQGSPLGPKASVISPANGTRLTFAELKDHVVALSTLAWLDCRACRGADAWIVDFWSLPTDRSAPAYARQGKFTTHYTNHTHDKIHPPPLMLTCLFSNPGGPLELALQGELQKKREESLIQALTYFYLSRFELPFYSTPGEDIETLWSGFESLYLNKGMGTNAGTNAKKTKDERLYKEILDSSSSAGPLSSEVTHLLKKWTVKFYDLRNYHTHGRGVEAGAISMNDIGSDAFQVGLRIAEAALLLQLGTHSPKHQAEALKSIESTFMWKQNAEELFRLIDGHDRKYWYPGPADPTHIERLSELMKGFERYRTMAKIDRHKGIKVAKKMVLVLSAWITALAKETPTGVNLEALNWLPVKFKELAGDNKKMPDNKAAEILQQLAGELKYNQAFKKEKICNGEIPSGLTLGDKITISEWIGCYIDLCDVLWSAT